jgi:hypothetical protein
MRRLATSSPVGDIIVRSFNGLGRRRWTSEVVCHSQARFRDSLPEPARSEIFRTTTAPPTALLPAGVELGRASMPAVAAFHRIQSLPACQQALPGRRLRGFAGSGRGYPFGRPVCLCTASRRRIGKLNSVRFRTELLPEPPRNRRLGTRFMFRKRPKIVVLMQHPATTWRGTSRTPKKSAVA